MRKSDRIDGLMLILMIMRPHTHHHGCWLGLMARSKSVRQAKRARPKLASTFSFNDFEKPRHTLLHDHLDGWVVGTPIGSM